ncbi:MAG TPA: nucleotidyltransferase family protein [Steroidobacteraceae bacterium]|nr:nucleotidyltransferase family protein [Steroidobacteraceae bacterium]
MSRRDALSLNCVVLAAGASTRFGSPKQLARFQGQTLLQRVLATAHEVTATTITVVVGAHAADVVEVLPPGRATVLVNREWREGIASSLRAAVRALPGACDGVLIVLADQPLVAAAQLNRLVSVWRRQPKRIVASQYEGTTGVPAIFPRWCFSELCALRGDQGARALILRHADHVTRLALPEAAVDIDQPEDLLNLT